MRDKKHAGSRLPGQLAGILFFLLMGAACGLTIAVISDRAGVCELPFGSFFLLLLAEVLLLYAAIFTQFLLHETGHLVFGLATGYRFSSFRIGSLMLLRSRGRLCLRRFSLAGTGGQCLMSPPEMRGGKLPFVLYNLGGAIMNLVLAALFLGLYFILRGGPLLSMFCLLMCVCGVGIGLTNGIPLRMSAIDNDGMNAVSLGRSPRALRAFWIQMTVNARSADGVRLRDMPEEWFEMPEKEELGNGMTAALAVLCAERLMDARDFDAAAELIDRLCAERTAIAGIHSFLLSCDRLCCELLCARGKGEEVQPLSRERLALMRRMKRCPAVIRTEYFCALLRERDGEKAGRLLRRFERVAKAYPYSGDIEGERELLQLARAAA